MKVTKFYYHDYDIDDAYMFRFVTNKADPLNCRSILLYKKVDTQEKGIMEGNSNIPKHCFNWLKFTRILVKGINAIHGCGDVNKIMAGTEIIIME